MRVQYKEKFLRRRRMLLLLPVIVCPMLCLAFYGLGGGKGKGSDVSVSTAKGINMKLPDASFDPRKKVVGKLGFYQQADQDSLRLAQSRKQDPYSREFWAGQGTGGVLAGQGMGASLAGQSGFMGKVLPDTSWRKTNGFRSGVGVRGVGTGIRGTQVPTGLHGIGPAPGAAEEQANELLKKLDLLKEVLSRQAGSGEVRGLAGGAVGEGLVQGSGGRSADGGALREKGRSLVAGIGDGSAAERAGGSARSGIGGGPNAGRTGRLGGPEIGSGLAERTGGLARSELRTGSNAENTGRIPIHQDGDPDLDKLSGMLDKILRIQHPGDDQQDDTIGVKVGGSSATAAVEQLTVGHSEELIRTLPVAGGGGRDMGWGIRSEHVVRERAMTGRSAGRSADTGEDSITVNGEGRPDPGSERDREGEVPGTGFIEIDDGAKTVQAGDNTIEAVMARDQTVVSGEWVDMRLGQEAFIGGVRISEGCLLSGKASLSGERLLVAISSIRVGTNIVPVSLEVVDLDGVAGIRERGSMNRDVAKESAADAVGGVGLTSLDPGLGAQVASAGIQAAKTLVSRKVRLVRVSVKAGYRVLLRNTKVNR